MKTCKIRLDLERRFGFLPGLDSEMYLEMHFAIDEDDVLAYEWVTGVLEQNVGGVE